MKKTKKGKKEPGKKAAVKKLKPYQRKKRKPKKVKKNEVRMHKKNGHPAYIYLEQGEDAHVFSITHAKETRGKRNIKLPNNPNPKDDRESYVLPKPKKTRKKQLRKKKDGWRMSRKNKDRLPKLKK